MPCDGVVLFLGAVETTMGSSPEKGVELLIYGYVVYVKFHVPVKLASPQAYFFIKKTTFYLHIHCNARKAMILKMGDKNEQL